ncbi:MAG: glycoside hydrolase family protein [Pirellulales bacterium]|nr:glycoside hydrolase family protein [Pirellulales bacterium]
MFFNKNNDIDVDQLREQLTIDEGKVLEIYHDHLGLPTVGIGHLILDSDEESGQALGTEITEERCVELFESDLESVVADCKILHEGWDGYPQEVKQVVANMMFNMGRTRLSKFKKHNAALVSGDWKEAAVEGRDSKWYRQVTNRAERLMSRLEKV